MNDVVIRAYASEFSRPARDKLEVRLIPYGVPTQVADVLPNGTLDSYIEEFAPSMFSGQVRAAHPETFRKIRFFDGHPNGDGATRLGWALTLRADPDWLYGTIQLMPTRVDDVEAMLDSGIRDVSVGFIPGAGGTIQRADGSRLRIKGHLDHIALEPEGAYPGAEVLAMRAKQAEEEEAQLLAATETLDRAELDAWLRQAEEAQAVFSSRARHLG